MVLEIVFENEDLIAINKPHGLLVHKSSIARDATVFAVQVLRDQIGQKVYPVHRLDRKTSGVLLFAKNKAANVQFQAYFRERKVQKTYKAIVRGYLPDAGMIDYALTNEDKTQAAQTEYTCLQHFEIPVPSAGFPTSRYSFAELRPLTGRFHQLRKHLAHIFHPILGDRPHGCNKQNRLWKTQFQMDKMLLHAESLVFTLPDEENIRIEATWSSEFQRVLDILNTWS